MHSYGPSAKGLEAPIRPTMPHLAPDYWITFGITQHRSGNCLSLSKESTSMEHAHRNGNIHRRTSHTTMMTMMTMMIPGQQGLTNVTRPLD